MAVWADRFAKCSAWFLGLAILIFPSVSRADSTVPLSLNALTIFNNSSLTTWGGRGIFFYDTLDGNVTEGSLGQFGSFAVDSMTGGGGGVGWNVALNDESPFDQISGAWLDVTAADYPILNRAGFGTNFNPDNYKLEVSYRPLENNEASVFNITFDTYDGFQIETRTDQVFQGNGKRYAEQQQWGFGYPDITGNGTVIEGEGERGVTIQEYYDANPKDADGFATISAPLTDGMGGVSEWWRFSGPSFMFASGSTAFQGLQTIEGDGLPDFGTFEDLAPNGVVQLHLQAAYSDEYPERLNMEVKRVSVVPIVPTSGEVARLDAMSGTGRRFGTPFSTQTSPDGVSTVNNPINHRSINVDGPQGPMVVVHPTDQLQRFDQDGFTNLIIQTDDDHQTGGFGIWTDHLVQTFDGTQATMEVRARLTQPLGDGQADRIDIVLNDLDGNDLEAGMGGEEYKYYIDLNNFNTSEFTTLSIPLVDFDERNQAFEHFFDGDGSLEDFNLYYMGVLTLQDAGLVDLELEYIRVMLPSAELDGDFNGDGTVDAADYTTWRDTGGSPEQFAQWKGNFGAGQGGGALASAAAVPEPATGFLAIVLLAICWRRQRNSPAMAG